MNRTAPRETIRTDETDSLSFFQRDYRRVRRARDERATVPPKMFVIAREQRGNKRFIRGREHDDFPTAHRRLEFLRAERDERAHGHGWIEQARGVFERVFAIGLDAIHECRDGVAIKARVQSVELQAVDQSGRRPLEFVPFQRGKFIAKFL